MEVEVEEDGEEDGVDVGLARPDLLGRWLAPPGPERGIPGQLCDR